MNLPIKRLDTGIPLPAYAHEGDAGLDLRCRYTIDIGPGQRLTVPTGIALELPPGYAGLVMPRSGLAKNSGLTIVNTPGLIDSGYRGEISVILLNTDRDRAFHAERGERIAQLVVIAVEQVSVTESDAIASSERGIQGFGSSGTH